MTDDLEQRIGRRADECGFSGVVHVERPDRTATTVVRGLADRAHEIPNTAGTRFGIASGVKGITALTMMSLVGEGVLSLDTTARAILGADLPLVDDRVTIEHLLAHRAGIGDYLDEATAGDITDHVMPVPVHQLADSEDYLAVLDGHPQVFEPGARFAYCNSGYVLLALLTERVTLTPFADLVAERVLRPAGMTSSGFLRSDELPGDAAVGYLHDDGLRSNVLHLPVRGSGDGGMYSTSADVCSFWQALCDGAIVPTAIVERMLEPHSDVPAESMAYGLGFWLHPSGAPVLAGYDAGVSFRTAWRRDGNATYVVLANTSSGAWPVSTLLDEILLGS